MTLEVVGYLRVSGYEQIDGDGFKRQRDEIERWCAAHNAICLRYFEERAVSGRRGLDDDEVNRPAFAEMVSALLSNGCRTIVVECLDRFARNLAIQTQLIVYLRSKGLTLISAMTGDDVTAAIDADKDPMRWAMVQMQGVFAELDRNMTVRKLRVARERKRRSTGRCEGPPPFGHDPSRPHEHTVLARMQELAHAHQRRAVADLLNQEGHVTRYGRQWTPHQVSRTLLAHRRLSQFRQTQDV